MLDLCRTEPMQYAQVPKELVVGDSAARELFVQCGDYEVADGRGSDAGQLEESLEPDPFVRFLRFEPLLEVLLFNFIDW